MKILLSIVLIMTAVFSLFFEVDKIALELYYQNFDRAVYSFALAKGLNAIISVIQSSEINVSFFVGTTIGLGQILDPLNDLIERFSWVMLASSVSIGIQHLLLVLGKSLFVKFSVGFGVVFTLLIMWIKKLHNVRAFLIFVKIVFLLLILRFGAVLFIYANDSLYHNIYEQNYQNSTNYISGYKNDLEEIQKEHKKLDTYWEKFEENMEVFSKKVVKLITMFVVSTVLFPLVFLWFLLSLIRWIFNLKFDEKKILILLNKKGLT